MKKLLTIVFIIICTNLFADDFKFIVWGDTQFQNPEVFEEFVAKTVLLNPDFVLHVGDMIHGYTYNRDIARREWTRFKKQISPLKVNFYPTPGNHDVTTKEIEASYAEVWNQKKFYYSFTEKNSLFIVLNPFENQDFYKISDEQFLWLKEQLAAGGNKNIFLSIHAPLHISHPEEWQRIHELLLQHKVIAVFTGHHHIYDYRNIKGIDYFCLNTSGNIRFADNHLTGVSHHMLLVEVKDDKILYTVISRDNILPHDIVNNAERNRAAKYYENNKSIILNRANKIDTLVSIEVQNRSDEDREYFLQWELKDIGWEIEPFVRSVKVEAGASISVEYKFYCELTDYMRTSLPKLKITSPYKTMNGIDTETKYYYKVFFPPSVNAYEISGAIKIDGHINERFWQNAEGISSFYTDYEDTPAEFKTEVKLLYDSENIYISVKGEESNPENLSALAYGEIPLVFGDDDFELFFDTNRDLSTFFRIMVNPKNVRLSSGPKGLFSFDLESAVYVGKDFWSAEFKIPFKELEIGKPGASDIWGFNVRRHRQQSFPNQSDWSKMQQHPPYQLEYFGLLKFR